MPFTFRTRAWTRASAVTAAMTLAGTATVVLGSMLPAAADDVAPAVPWTPPAHSARPALNVDYKNIVSPIESGFVSGNDWGAPRNGGRKHQGNDLFAPKMSHAVAAVDGVISYLHTDATGLSGNMIVVTGPDGWMYVYMHLNNDTPGTDDGSNKISNMLAPGIAVGTPVHAGQFIAYVGDSGNAEDMGSHVHFEIRRPNNVPIDPYISVRKAQHKSWTDNVGLINAPSSSFGGTRAPAMSTCVSIDQASGPEKRLGGYVALGSDGGVFTFGDAVGSGSLAGMHLNGAPVAIASTPGGHGYWVAAADGGVFTFGDAPVLGSIASTKLNRPIVGIAATPTGQGYWLVGGDGGVFTFGDAGSYGSMAATKLTAPVVGIAATPAGHGYWLAARDGGVFAFGDAAFLGGANTLHLPDPITAISSAPSGMGYWLLARDGGVFAFGNAPYVGSLPGLGLCDAPHAVAIASSPTGRGYWLATSDGRTWPFGDAPRVGSVADLHLPGSPGVRGLSVALPVAAAGELAANSVVVQCANGGEGGCPAASIADMFSVDWLRDLADESS